MTLFYESSYQREKSLVQTDFLKPSVREFTRGHRKVHPPSSPYKIPIHLSRLKNPRHYLTTNPQLPIHAEKFCPPWREIGVYSSLIPPRINDIPREIHARESFVQFPTTTTWRWSVISAGKQTAAGRGPSGNARRCVLWRAEFPATARPEHCSVSVPRSGSGSTVDQTRWLKRGWLVCSVSLSLSRCTPRRFDWTLLRFEYHEYRGEWKMESWEEGINGKGENGWWRERKDWRVFCIFDSLYFYGYS